MSSVGATDPWWIVDTRDGVLDLVARGDTPAPGARILSSYTVVRELGAGGSARVLLAHDPEGRQVALKVLRADQLGDQGITRFQREYATLTRVSHPNVVQVYQLGRAGPVPFIVLEYVDGPSLRRHLKDLLRMSGESRWQRIEEIMLDVALGLATTHRAGVIHRDVKPSNVLITRTGIAKLTDFGIARDLSADTPGGRLVGTWAYTAPELFKSGVADERADLYALGIVLYEMATGRRPFEAPDLRGYATAHLAQPVIDPRTIEPNMPTHLADLCLQLLQKNPRHRPGSAEAVAAAVRGRDPTIDSRPAATQWAPLLLGRRDAVRDLREAVASFHKNSNGLLYQVVGGPGLGKSRMLEEVHRSCRKWGIATLRVQVEDEALPFAASYQLARALQAELGAACPSRLASLLVGAEEAGHRLGSRLAMHDAIRDALETALVDAPLCLLLDDIHRTSATERQFLTGIVRNVMGARGLPLMVVASTADGPGDTLGHTSLGSRARRIDLQPLSPEEVGHLVEDVCGSSPAAELLALRLRESTRGNPRAVVDTLRALFARGLVGSFGSASTLRLGVKDVERLELPLSVGPMMQERIGRLGGAGRRTVEVLAASGRWTDLDTLVFAVGFPEERVLPGLTGLVQEGLVDARRSGERYEYTLPARPVREELLQRLTPSERTSTDRALAQALAAACDGTPPGLARVAHHYALANEPRDAWRYLCQAAAVARRSNLLQEAWVLAVQAAELTPRDLDQEDARIADDLEVLQAELSALRGPWDDAARRYEALADAARGRGDRVREAFFRAAIADVNLTGGKLEEAGASARRALELTQGPVAAAATAHRVLGAVAWRVGDLDVARASLERALAIDRQSADVAGRASTQRLLSRVLAVHGHLDRALAGLTEVERLLRALDLRDDRVIVLAEQADLMIRTGTLKEGIERAHTAAFLASEMEHRPGRAAAGRTAALGAMEVGDGQAAIGYLREALRVAETLGAPFAAMPHLVLLQRYWLEAEDFSASRWSGERALERAKGHADSEGYVPLVLVRLARASRSDPTRAKALIDEASARVVDLPSGCAAPVHLELGRAQAERDAIEDAARHGSKALELAEAQGQALLRVAAHALLSRVAPLDVRPWHVRRVHELAHRIGANLSDHHRPLFLGRILWLVTGPMRRS